MKSNLKYNWRIVLVSPEHRITAHKVCTIEEALIAADELETEVEWLVTGVFISRYLVPAVPSVRRIKLKLNDPPLLTSSRQP